MMAADVAEAISEDAIASEVIADVYTLAAPVKDADSEDVGELAFTTMLFEASDSSEAIDGSEPIMFKAYSLIDGSDDYVETSVEITPEMVMRTFSFEDAVEGVDKELALFDDSEIFQTMVVDSIESIDWSIELFSFDATGVDENVDGSPFIYYSMIGSGSNEDGEVRILESTSDDVDIQVTNFSLQNRWHNSSFPADIDGNNSVTPVDVLIVINALNEIGRGALVNIDLSQDSVGLSYLDVNHDTAVTPIDALIVINYINSSRQDASLINEDSESNSQSSLFAPEVGRIVGDARDFLSGDDLSDEQLDTENSDISHDSSDVMDGDSFASRIAYAIIEDASTEVDSDAKVIDAAFEDGAIDLLEDISVLA